MLFDAVVARCDPSEPDRKLVSRRVLEVIAAMGFVVDEASGEVTPKPAARSLPRQRNARWF